MISNLSLLGFFKYFNFLTFNYTALVESLGLTGMSLENVLAVTLPLGISFYTFQSMSYAIDVYRGDALAIRNPIDYWCYVAMFPQLVAGRGLRAVDPGCHQSNRMRAKLPLCRFRRPSSWAAV